jgi:FkbM family methyltransferase
LQTGSKDATHQTIRLRQFLSEQVDLLKLDIEGAETEVLMDLRRYVIKR